MTLNGGSPNYPAGMGSATCMMQTGPTAQMWSCSPILAIKGLVAISRANGVRVPFPSRHSRTNQMSINWHELYVVTMALAFWGPQLKGKHLLFHCDNTSVVHIMAKASTCSKTMMEQVCTFTLLSMQHNIQVHMQHITEVSNNIADALSCFEVDRFWQLCPHAEADPLPTAKTW